MVGFFTFCRNNNNNHFPFSINVVPTEALEKNYYRLKFLLVSWVLLVFEITYLCVIFWFFAAKMFLHNLNKCRYVGTYTYLILNMNNNNC